MTKGKIYYIYDALCGWCYGFSPVMKKIKDKYQDQYEFEALSGGMVTGHSVGPISQVAPYIQEAYKRVEQLSGVKFGEPFLKLLEEGSTMMSSEKPALAMTAFKGFQKENSIDFAHDLQKAFYAEGKDLEGDQLYKVLAKKYQIDPKDFTEAIGSQETIEKTVQEFRNVKHLDVSGFPTVIFYNGKEAKILARGFTDFGSMEKSILGLG